MSDPILDKFVEDGNNAMRLWLKDHPGKVIPSYTIKFTNKLGRLTGGQYFHRKKLIQVNWKYYQTFGYDSTLKIVLHELAHHIDSCIFGNNGHGLQFKKICKELGGDINSTMATGEFADCVRTDWMKLKWVIYTCNKCGYTFKRKRRLNQDIVDDGRYRCPKCRVTISSDTYTVSIYDPHEKPVANSNDLITLFE